MSIAKRHFRNAVELLSTKTAQTENAAFVWDQAFVPLGPGACRPWTVFCGRCPFGWSLKGLPKIRSVQPNNHLILNTVEGHQCSALASDWSLCSMLGIERI